MPASEAASVFSRQDNCVDIILVSAVSARELYKIRTSLPTVVDGIDIECSMPQGHGILQAVVAGV